MCLEAQPFLDQLPTPNVEQRREVRKTLDAEGEMNEPTVDATGTVVIATDGSCWPNPGPGGYAAILVFPDGSESVVTGHDRATTNNRMEMFAAIAGLEALESASQVMAITDSSYLQLGASNWVQKWARNGWKTRKGEVKNTDLWQRLIRAMNPHEVCWHRVRGHSGHPLNERADAIAEQESRKAGSFGQPSFITSKRRKNLRRRSDG